MAATTTAPTLVNIVLTSENLPTANLETILNLNPGVAGNDSNHAEKLSAFIAAGVPRVYPQNLALNVGAAQATATVTFASTGPTNTETMTILNVTFTAVTSGATNNQFNINASPTTVAANLAAAINASTSLKNMVTATSALGVVTVTSVVPGALGNGLEIANVNLANTTVTAFASGSDGDLFTINCK